MTLFKRGLSVFGAITVLAGIVAVSLTITGNSTTYGTATAKSVVATSTLALASGKEAILFTSATSSMNFPAVMDGMCSSTTMTVTGATTSTSSPNSVDIGYEPTFRSGYATNTNIFGYVSDANTVTISVCGGPALTPPNPMLDPPATVFRATVKNFNP